MFQYRVMWPSGCIGDDDFIAYEELPPERRSGLSQSYIAVLRAVAAHVGTGTVEVQDPTVCSPVEEIAHLYPDGAQISLDTAADLIRHMFATEGRTQWNFGIADQALLAFGDDPILYVASHEDLGPLIRASAGTDVMVDEVADPPLPYEVFDGESYVTTPADHAFWEQVRHACEAFPGPHLLQELWAAPAGVVYHDLTAENVDQISASLRPNSLVSAWFTVPRCTREELAARLGQLSGDDIEQLDVHLRLVPTDTSRLEHTSFEGADLPTEASRSDSPRGAFYCVDPDFDLGDTWLHAYLSAVVPTVEGTVKKRWTQEKDWLEADLRFPL